MQKGEEVLSTCYEIISIHNRYIGSLLIRETRVGWPPLTVATEVNGDSKSTKKGVLPWLVCGVERNFCSALAATVGPEQNIFFPYTISILYHYRPASWAKRRIGSPVSKYLSLVLRQEYLYWMRHPSFHRYEYVNIKTTAYRELGRPSEKIH